MEDILKSMVKDLDYNEVLYLKKDIRNSDSKFGKILDNEIKERKMSHQAYCSVCGSKIDPYSSQNYTLLFGPEDFKKKATFCALDCMEYFIQKLKLIKKSNPKKEVLHHK